VYVLNEVTIVPVLLRAVLGERPIVLSVASLMPPLRSAMSRLVAALSARGWIRRAGEVVSKLDRFDANPVEHEFNAVYPSKESAFERHFAFDRLVGRLGDYELIYKHETMNRLRSLMLQAHLLRLHGPAIFAVGERVVGHDRDLDAILALGYGAGDMGLGKPLPRFGRLWNFIHAVLLSLGALVSAGWLGLRPRAPRKAFRIGADLIPSEKVRRFFVESGGDPAETLFVCRNNAVYDSLSDEDRRKYRHCRPQDGWLPVGAALSAGAAVVADIWKLYAALGDMAPPLYFKTARHAVKRLYFRALFHRFPVANFLARDEYNSDHITRTQELRRAGARSYGISHGLSTGPRVYPQTRYIDFDVFFVFGMHQKTSYGDKWPTHVQVVPIGSYAIPRGTVARIPAARTKDIVCYANQVADTPEYVNAIRTLAEAFTDRRVVVKLKYNRAYIGAETYDGYLDLFAGFRDRIEVIEGDPYEILLTASYSFSGLSTIVAEALQMGVHSFFIDTFDRSLDILYRDYPGLCVADGADAVARIRAIEAGKARYPVETFHSLVPSGPPCGTQRIHDLIHAA